LSTPLEHEARDASAQRLHKVVRADPALLRRLRRPLTTGQKLQLAVEILAAYVRVRRALGRAPLPEQLALLRRGVNAPEVPAWQMPEQHIQAARLGRAVARVLPRLPGDTRCLTQALVLTHLLGRRGIGSTLEIAVAPGDDFVAHAWVEHGGVPLLRAEDPGFNQLCRL
jgi:Transglutaminase-like superfamily